MLRFLTLLILLAPAGLLPRLAAAQQQVISCNTTTGANCNTTSNPGNGLQGDPSWLAFGKTNANVAQLYGMLGGGGALPSPAYGVTFNNNGIIANLLPGSIGTWCLNWTSLTVAPTLVSCGSGAGSVTSVALTVPTWLSVSGSPVTTNGTLAISGTIEPNNYVLASAASGSSTVLAPRALVAVDITSALAGSTSINGTSIPASSTLLYGSGPLGTPSSGSAANLSNFPTLNQSTTGNAATASALAATPTQCSGSQFAVGVTAAGNANCATPTGSGNVSTAGTPTQYQIPAWTSGTTIQGIGPGTAGQALVSGGASAYPSYSSSLADVTSVNGTTIPAASTLLTSGGALGTPSSGSAANLTSFPTLNQNTTGTAANVTATSNGTLTTLSALSLPSGQMTGLGTFATQNYASPPAIGGTTPAAGAFSTLSASGAVSGAGFSSYLAAPPAIGGTTPAGGAFTTLSASGSVSGAGFSAYLASPPAIGGTTAAAGTFSSLTDSGVTGLIQCLHASSTGVISGTGADCGSGGGAVTSVSGDGALITNSASSGAVTLALGNTGVGYGVFGGITASSGAPAYHALSTYPTAAFPTLNQNTTGTAANITDTSNSTLTTLSALSLPVTQVSGLGTGVATFLATPSSANFAAAVTGETGTGALVFGTSPTLVTPALGTPSALVLTNATGLPNASVIGLGTFATQNYASPPAIGGTTPAGGAFTTLSASSTVSGTGFSTYLASPPAIGGTTAAAGTFSALTDSGITGSTQCLHVNTSGLVSGTGSDCGSGGGSGTVNSGASGDLAYYASTGTAVSQLAIGGNLALSSGTLITSQPINAQTGTTYTMLSSDAGKLVTFTNASAIAVTLPVATSAGFTAGYSFDVQVPGAGTATITPTTSTINGAASLAIASGRGCTITSDGTNYQVSACTATVTGGTGTVTSASVVTANGFSGSVATATTTPAITLSVNSNGVLKGVSGNLTSATAGTDFVVPGGPLGTPSSGTLTYATGLPITTGVSGLATGMAAYLAANTTFTIAATGCTPSAHAGGAFAGTITLASGPCTSIVVTMNGATGYTTANGYHCNVGDRTTQAAGTYIPMWGESATTTTTATLPIPGAAGATDVISFECRPY